MAIMRDQRGSNLNPAGQGVPNVQQAQSPFGLAGRDTQIDTSSSDTIQRVLGMASQLAGQAFEHGVQEEYLRGANAAASGQALDSLNSNWLTRTFNEGGFNDQTKRLQMASVVSDITANMAEYKKLSPQEFLQVVNDKTQGLFTDTNGMSMKGREQLFENQLTFNNTLIRTQAAQHGKFLIDQRAQMYNAQGNSLITMAAQAKASGDNEAYASASAATMSWAKSILGDEKLPIDIRQQQVTSMMGLMLSQDLRTPVQLAVNSGMFNSLGADDLAKLQGQIRESENRTQVQDNSALLDQWSQLRVRQDIYGDVDPKQFNALMGQMVGSNLMTKDGYLSAQQDFYKDYAKQAKASQLAQAFATGNQTYMLSVGASEQDGVNAFIKSRMRGNATATDVAFDLLNIGKQNGFPAAYQGAAKLLEPSLSNFGTEAEMSPDAANNVKGMVDRIAVAETQGDKTGWFKLLSGLSPENQEKMVYIREQVKAGKSLNQAAQGYVTQQQAYAGMTPAQKSQILTERQTDIKAVMNTMDAEGWWSRTGQAIAGIFSQRSADMFQARVASGDYTTNQQMQEVSTAYREELQSVTLKNPNISKDGMAALAASSLSKRVLRVGETTLSPGSVLIAPKDRTVQSMLGLPAEVAPDRIGRAIAALDQSKAPEGYESTYSFSPDGKLAVQYFNKNGDIAPTIAYIDPAVVANRIREDDLSAATANNEVYGDGKLFVDRGSNVGIRVNGVNTANIDENQMLYARGKLIDFEGIRNQTYRDSRGVSTNGVGISDRSPFYAEGNAAGMRGGTEWSARTIHDTFVNHTNMVARQMPGQASALGWETSNNAQFQFMMQMGYQAGSDWYRTSGPYSKLADAIRLGNKEDAVAALSQTPAFKLSQDDRKRYYIQTLSAGMSE